MDIVTAVYAANKAKADLAASGQVGSVEPGKVFTFDGNLEGRQYVDYGDFGLVKISDEPINLNDAKKVVWKKDNGESVTVTNIELYKHSDKLISVDGIRVNNSDLVVTCYSENHGLSYYNGVTVGTYLYKDNTGCTSYLEVAGTVHHIDQKFIPAMDSITLNGADGKQYKFSVDASGNPSIKPIE